MSELPPGWARTTLGSLGTWASGGTPPSKDSRYYGGDILWVRTGDLRDNELFDVEGRITEAGLTNSAAKIFPEGTLLVAMYGATIGRTGLLRRAAATNQACAAFLPNGITEDIIPFLWKFLRHKADYLKSIGQGGAQPNISQTVLKEVEIALPPLAEQKRIVTKLDGLFARTEIVREEISKIAALNGGGTREARLLDNLEEAIFSKAFCGKLVPQDLNDEPAEKLLQRIHQSRTEGIKLARQRRAS